MHSFARIETTNPLIYVLKSGWIGVNAFFIASGFVLYLPYAQGRRSLDSMKDATAFYRHRAMRLVPLCFFGSLVAVMLIQPPPITSTHFWILLLNLPFATFSWIQGYNIIQANGALWSISVEMALSAIFPLLVIAVMRFGFRHVFSVLIPIWLCFRIFLWLEGSDAIAHFQSHFGLAKFGMFYNDTMGISTVEFLAGICIASLYVVNPKGRSAPFTIVGAIFVSVFLFLFWSDGSTLDVHSPHSLLDVFLPMSLDVGLAALFWGILRISPDGVLYRVLCNRPLQIAGLMCYSLYIWHPPLFAALGNPLGPHAKVFAAVIVLAFILAAFSYRYLEFPRRSVSELFLLPSNGEPFGPNRGDAAPTLPRS